MMVYDSGKWNDLTCTTSLPYVCQFTRFPVPAQAGGGGSGTHGGLIAFIFVVFVLGAFTFVYVYKFPDDARSKVGAVRDLVTAGVSKVTGMASLAAQYRPMGQQDPGDFNDDEGFDDAFRVPADDAPVFVNSAPEQPPQRAAEMDSFFK